MDFSMFWGGAPLPLNTAKEDANAIRAAEPQLARDHEEDSGPESEYYNPQTGETRNAEQTRQTLKVHGGKAATSKRIAADYDDDDARLIELKQQGYTDEYVASQLALEGRTRYVAKTIGSRWLRLRNVLEQQADEKLDDELSDWHFGEDEMLADIKYQVDLKFDVKREELEARYWKEIAIFLNERIGRKKYTEQSCKARHQAIIDGTALLPIELDDDVVGRNEMRRQRQANARAARHAAYEAEQNRIDRKAAKIAARAQAKKEEVLRKQAESEKRAKDREVGKRVQIEREQTRIKAKYAREVQLIQARANRDWAMERNRMEKAVYMKVTGKRMPGCGTIGARKPRDKGEDDSDDENGFIDDLESDEREAQSTDEEIAITTDHTGDGSDGDDESNGKETRRPRRVTVSRKPKPTTKKFVLEKALVTPESLSNRRSILNLEKLNTLLSQRGLPARAPTETHPEIVARLAHEDQQLSKADLDALLRAMHEKVSGTRAQRIYRLEQAHAATSTMASAGYSADDMDWKRNYEGYQGKFKYLLGVEEGGNAGLMEDVEE